jgi:hypothetical protein
MIRLSNIQPVEMSLRMTAALDYVAAGDETEIRHHFLWVVKKMMADMVPEDLTTAELVTTIVAWTPAHSRIISGRTGGEPTAAVLQLVPRDDSTSVDDIGAG